MTYTSNDSSSTSDSLSAALAASSDAYGNMQLTPDQLSAVKQDYFTASKDYDATQAKEITNETSTFDQKPPQEDRNVLGGLIPLLAIGAFGGKATKLNANAMLGASIGMVQGYTQGKQEVYDQHQKQFEQAYQQWKDRREQQDKVYKEMREAYKGRIDADIKALQFARQVTGDEAKNNANLLRDKEIEDKQAQQLQEFYDKLTETKTHDRNTEEMAKKRFDFAKSQAGANITYDAASMAVDRIMNGEKTSEVLGNIGRGKQGAADIAMVQNLLAQRMNEKNMSAEDIATKKQELAALARTRTELGAREGKIAPRVQEAKLFAQNAIAASDKVPRGSWTDASKMIQTGEAHTSNKELGQFMIYNNSLINAYSAAVGGGVMHVDDTKHARDMLSTADSPETYKAKVQALIVEADAALKAPEQVMGGLRKPTEVAPASAPAPSTTPPVTPQAPAAQQTQQPAGTPPNVVSWSSLQ